MKTSQSSKTEAQLLVPAIFQPAQAPRKPISRVRVRDMLPLGSFPRKREPRAAKAERQRLWTPAYAGATIMRGTKTMSFSGRRKTSIAAMRGNDAATASPCSRSGRPSGSGSGRPLALAQFSTARGRGNQRGSRPAGADEPGKRRRETEMRNDRSPGSRRRLCREPLQQSSGGGRRAQFGAVDEIDEYIKPAPDPFPGPLGPEVERRIGIAGRFVLDRPAQPRIDKIRGDRVNRRVFVVVDQRDSDIASAQQLGKSRIEKAWVPHFDDMPQDALIDCRWQQGQKRLEVASGKTQKRRELPQYRTKLVL